MKKCREKVRCCVSGLDYRNKGLAEFFEKLDNTILDSVDSEVFAGFGARPGVNLGTNLANNDFTGVDFLTTKNLYSPALTGTIRFLIGFSLGFSVGHSLVTSYKVYKVLDLILISRILMSVSWARKP